MKRKIEQIKNINFDKQKFKEFKEFKVKKQILETNVKKLYDFYDFNKTALISEFSMKDFYSFLEKNKIFLEKHNDEYETLLNKIQVKDKIANVISFNESKMLFQSKNFLPRNLCKIYLPVDHTNIFYTYDCENERFSKTDLFPKKLTGFHFFPYSRFLNFNGRLFVSGGYENRKLSRTLWALEDKNNFINPHAIIEETQGNNQKATNISKVYHEFYQNINDKNFIYEDENFPNFSIIRCTGMVYPRAGHSMVGLTPSLIMVFGGTENTRSCEIFHFETNRWEEIASLQTARIDSSVVIFKNYIYVFFGFIYDRVTKKYSFLDSIERITLLNAQNSEWEYVVPKLSDIIIKDILPRSLCGVVIKGENSSSIYLCGGQVGKDKYSNDIFEFNLEFATLSLSEKKLPKASGFLEQNFIYLFKTGISFDVFGDIFYYHTNTDSFNFHYQKTKSEKAI